MLRFLKIRHLAVIDASTARPCGVLSTLDILRLRWPDTVFLNYSGDDMFNPRNQTPEWRASLPLFDLHATTKR